MFWLFFMPFAVLNLSYYFYCTLLGRLWSNVFSCVVYSTPMLTRETLLLSAVRKKGRLSFQEQSHMLMGLSCNTRPITYTYLPVVLLLLGQSHELVCKRGGGFHACPKVALVRVFPGQGLDIHIWLILIVRYAYGQGRC